MNSDYFMKNTFISGHTTIKDVFHTKEEYFKWKDLEHEERVLYLYNYLKNHPDIELWMPLQRVMKGKNNGPDTVYYDEAIWVSSDGRIFNINKNDYVTPRINHNGYLRYMAKRVSINIQRAVAYLYCPRLNNVSIKHSDLQVDHINNIRVDNKFINLAWLTPEQNKDKGNLSENKLSCRNVFELTTDPRYYGGISKTFHVLRSQLDLLGVSKNAVKKMPIDKPIKYKGLTLTRRYLLSILNVKIGIPEEVLKQQKINNSLLAKIKNNTTYIEMTVDDKKSKLYGKKFLTRGKTELKRMGFGMSSVYRHMSGEMDNVRGCIFRRVKLDNVKDDMFNVPSYLTVGYLNEQKIS